MLKQSEQPYSKGAHEQLRRLFALTLSSPASCSPNQPPAGGELAHTPKGEACRHTLLSGWNMSTDDLDPENFVNPASGDDLAAQDIDDAGREHLEVMEEDLGTQDLVDDGTDPARMMPDDLERPVDDALHLDEPHAVTIEERIAQEEPEG